METMETPKKPGIMAQLRNSKGFSLIEMAIVLVIIGIIIAAIIKGQDLMFNSRAKQLVSTTNSWKIAAFAYMDRNGRFPGDFARDGVIGLPASEAVTSGTAVYEISSTLSNAPANPILIGGQSYWFYIGHIDATAGTRNVVVICPSIDCVTVLSPDGVEMFKALDTSIDGTADAGVGQMRALTTSGGALTASILAAPGSRDNGVPVLTNAGVPSYTANGSATLWSNAHFGAVWAFDKQF